MNHIYDQIAAERKRQDVNTFGKLCCNCDKYYVCPLVEDDDLKLLSHCLREVCCVHCPKEKSAICDAEYPDDDVLEQISYLMPWDWYVKDRKW